MPYTQQIHISCHICGYPDQLAANRTVQKNHPRRGAQNSVDQNSEV